MVALASHRRVRCLETFCHNTGELTTEIAFLNLDATLKQTSQMGNADTLTYNGPTFTTEPEK